MEFEQDFLYTIISQGKKKKQLLQVSVTNAA